MAPDWLVAVLSANQQPCLKNSCSLMMVLMQKYLSNPDTFWLWEFVIDLNIDRRISKQP